MLWFKFNGHLKSSGRKRSDGVHTDHTEITKPVPRSRGSISKHELPPTYRGHGFLRHFSTARFRYAHMFFPTESSLCEPASLNGPQLAFSHCVLLSRAHCLSFFTSNTYRLCHNCSCSSPLHSCFPRNMFYQVIASATRDGNIFGQAVLGPVRHDCPNALLQNKRLLTFSAKCVNTY
jgi:hypothetical protein